MQAIGYYHLIGRGIHLKLACILKLFCRTWKKQNKGHNTPETCNNDVYLYFKDDVVIFYIVILFLLKLPCYYTSCICTKNTSLYFFSFEEGPCGVCYRWVDSFCCWCCFLHIHETNLNICVNRLLSFLSSFSVGFGPVFCILSLYFRLFFFLSGNSGVWRLKSNVDAVGWDGVRVGVFFLAWALWEIRHSYFMRAAQKHFKVPLNWNEKHYFSLKKSAFCCCQVTDSVCIRFLVLTSVTFYGILSIEVHDQVRSRQILQFQSAVYMKRALSASVSEVICRNSYASIH